MAQLKELHEIILAYKKIEIPGWDLSFDDTMKRRIRKSKALLMGVVTMQLTGGVIFFVPFFYAWIFSSRPNSELQFPILSYFPVNHEQRNAYYIFFLIYQTSILNFFNFSGIAMDFFIMDIILIHNVQIEHLDKLLAKIISGYYNGEYDKEHAKYLKIWIKQHQRVNRCCWEMRKLVASFIFIHYIMVVTCVGIGIVLILEAKSWTFAQQASVGGVFFYLILILYILATQGSELASTVKNMESTFYGLWLTSSKNLKLAHTMCTCLYHKPFYITFHLTYPLCYTTFLIILKLVMTYYMALREVQNRRNNMSHKI